MKEAFTMLSDFAVSAITVIVYRRLDLVVKLMVVTITLTGDRVMVLACAK